MVASWKFEPTRAPSAEWGVAAKVGGLPGEALSAKRADQSRSRFSRARDLTQWGPAGLCAPPGVAQKDQDLASGATGADFSPPRAARTRRWQLDLGHRDQQWRRLESGGGGLRAGAQHLGTAERSRSSRLSDPRALGAARGPHLIRERAGAPWRPHVKMGLAPLGRRGLGGRL